ncbi:MAG: cyclic nucleotide-binding domain-containing protein, partial [Alphaproteobacteria bacterium]|nr:cyclic nucleotide-binding domain-containing protein [Alphaproteobacteria bacterium]
RPVRPPQYDAKAESERAVWVKEASAAGNTTVDLASDWVDYTNIGIADEDGLSQWVTQIVKLVDLEDDVLSRGLQQAIKPDDRPDLTAKLLEARRVLLTSIRESDAADAVELFDPDAYNTNATLSENLLFGRHMDQSFDVYHLGEQPYLLDTLEKHDLLDRLTDIGLQTASTMLEMFRDLPEDDERLERLSMIDRESMPEYEALVQRAERDGVQGLPAADRNKLLSLAFMQAPAHQRFGLIDEGVQAQIVAARRSFRDNLPADLDGKIEFFDAEKICGGVTIQCNLLFGRIAKSQSRHVINDLMRQAIDTVGIRDDLLCLGLDSNVGTAGSRLSPSQRQKLTLARALIKRPCLLILNEAINALDQNEQDKILDRILDLLDGQGLIWIDRERDGLDRFDQILTMRSGRVVKRRQRDAGTVEAEETHDGASDHTVDEAMSVLQRVPFLQGLDPSTVKLLAYAGDQQRYDAGEIVFVEGDEGETACFILDGEATASVGGGPARHVVGQLEPGDVVGEIALLLDAPRSATVTATTELTVLSLSRELFVDLMRKDQELGISVMRTLAERLATALQRIDGGAGHRADVEVQPG